MWIADVSAQRLVDLFERGLTREPVMAVFIPGDTASATMLAELQGRVAHFDRVLGELVAYVFISDHGEGLHRVRAGSVITPEHVEASLRPALAYGEHFGLSEPDLPGVVFLFRGISEAFSMPLENMTTSGLEGASRSFAEYLKKVATLEKLGARIGSPKHIIKEYNTLLSREKKFRQRYRELAGSVATNLKLDPEQLNVLHDMLWSSEEHQKADIEKVAFPNGNIKRESRIDGMMTALKAHAQVRKAMQAAPTASEIDDYLIQRKSAAQELHVWLEQCFHANFRRARIGTPASAWDRAKEMTNFVADLVTIGSATMR